VDNCPVTPSLSSQDRALCERLVGGVDRLTPAVIDAACRHRVHLLVADSLTAAERAGAETAHLARELRMAAAFDRRSSQAIASLLEALAAAGVDALLLKGAGLAYTVYPAPYLRARVDTDLLVDRAALDRAEQVLAAAGWHRPVEREVALTAAQRHYTRSGMRGPAEHIDLHWRIANPLQFARALSFEELRSRALPVPALGPHAFMPGLADALLLACLHRVAHHHDEVQLLWLWDIHLLIQRMSWNDRDAFVRLAERERMCAICRRGVELSAECFSTSGARELAGVLRQAAGGRREPTARFIGGSRLVTVLRSDLAALDGWRRRAALIAEHLFPSSAYMRSVYPGCPPALLPLVYGYRIARGAPKWFIGRS
jgi:hypothetical protein